MTDLVPSNGMSASAMNASINPPPPSDDMDMEESKESTTKVTATRPIHLTPSPSSVALASISPEHALIQQMNQRAKLVESGLKALAPGPSTIERREADYLLASIHAYPHQRQTRVKLEQHAREIIRERAREQPFHVTDELTGQSASLYRPEEYEVKSRFFTEFLPPPPPIAQPTTADATSSQLPPGITASTSSSSAQAPSLPRETLDSFTTPYAVPSLQSQLPPPVTPQVIRPPTVTRLASIKSPTGGPPPPIMANGPSNMAEFQQLLMQQLTNGLASSNSLPPLPQTHLHQLALMMQQQQALLQQQQNATAQTQSQMPTLQQQQRAALAQQLWQRQFLMKQYQDQQMLMAKHGVASSSSPYGRTVNFAYERYEADKAQRALREKMRLQKLREVKEKQRVHNLFLKELKQHQRDFQEYHQKTKKTLKQLSKEAARLEFNFEKQRQIEETKQARQAIRAAEERIAALKKDDFQAYAALMKDCKSQRIQLLLQQTTKWEQKLKQMILDKKRAGLKEDRLQREKLAHLARVERNIEEKKSMDDTDVTMTDATSTQPTVEIDESTVLELEDEKITQPALMSGGELKQYQLVGIQWLVSLYNNHLNGILADEMGLGKTIQTIGLIAYLMETKNIPGPYLVIAPLSTQKNWLNEFKKWTPKIVVVPFTGLPEQRTKLWKTSLRPGCYNVVMVSYEYIMNKNDRAKLAAVQWKYIIIDEGHRMKNHQSKLAVTLHERYHSPHRLILSGTPLQNSLIELWSLLNFLLPTIFDSSESFQEWFSKPFEKQGLAAANKDEPTDELLDEEEKLLIIHRLHSILRPFLLRRMKKDVASQLPPKREFIIKSRLTSWQQIMYKQILSHRGVQTVDASGQVKSKKLMNTFMQLRKIVNHPYLFEATNPDFHTNFQVGPELIRSSGKFDLLHRMLPKLIKTGHKILLFCQMTLVLDFIEDYCHWKGIQMVRLDGHCHTQERSDAQDKFNAPDSQIHLFIMSTRAGGLGLNLQVADTVILFDSDWNPQMDLQAMDRAHRLGQKNEVRIFRFISLSPVEELVLTRAQTKLKIDQMVIQSGKFDKEKKSTADERKELLQDILRRDIQTGETAAPSDEEVNRMMARSEAEFKIFQQMDREITAEDERVWKEQTKSNKPCPGRLITEEELPLHIRQIDLEKLLEADENEPPRSRAVKKANAGYSVDSLSDREWTKCVEKGIDPTVYAAKKAAKKAAKAKGSETASAKKSKSSSQSKSPEKDENDEDDEHALDLLNDENPETPSDSDEEGSDISLSDEDDDNDEESPQKADTSDSDASFVAPRKPKAGATKGRPSGKKAAPTKKSTSAKKNQSSRSTTPGRPGRNNRSNSQSASASPMEVDEDDEDALPSELNLDDDNDDDSEVMILGSSIRPQSSTPVMSRKRKNTHDSDADEDEVTPVKKMGRPRKSPPVAVTPSAPTTSSTTSSPALQPALSRRDFQAMKRDKAKAEAAAPAAGSSSISKSMTPSSPSPTPVRTSRASPRVTPSSSTPNGTKASPDPDGTPQPNKRQKR